MLTDDEVPPLPMFESTHARPDGIVTLYREEEILEWGRAVEQAAYAAAIKACESLENRVVSTHPARIEFDPNSFMARKCAGAIRSLMTQEQPK